MHNINIQTMIGGPGTTTPNYVRSATFTNTSAGEVTLNVTFQSGNTEAYTIAAGSNQNVEKDIQHDGFTTVDPITGFSATAGGHTANADFAAASGIENRNYNIGENGVATQA